MEPFSALLAICAGNSPVPGEFPALRPVTRSFDVFFDLRLNKQLSEQSWDWWFETLSRPLWRHCNYAPNLNNGLTKQPLWSGHGWVNTPHCFTWTQLLIHALIPMLVYSIHVSKWSPRVWSQRQEHIYDIIIESYKTEIYLTSCLYYCY